ncbi:MAG: thiolase family protein [Pseudomonadota bacterium]
MKSLNDVVIVSAVRSPFSRFGGLLRNVHSMDIAAQIMRSVLDRVSLDMGLVDIVFYGMCVQSEAGLESNIIGRQAQMRAGFPPEVLSLTIDRACCSSLAAVQLGCKDILLKEVQVALAVGAENMSNTPFLIQNCRWSTGLEQPRIKDQMFPIGYNGFDPVAVDAGEVALEHGVSREEQDEWAYQSQKRYQQAKAEGKFNEEIIPVTITTAKGEKITLDADEFPKPQTTLEKLASLKPVYGSPTVTPGNAPGLDAGASAVLLLRREKAEQLGLKPLARVVAFSNIALPPRLIASAPAPAIQKALDKAGLIIEDMDLLEINEAFAAMPLVSTKLLGNGDPEKVSTLRNKTNVNGGAIAVGHPVGASGARILMTLMYELRRRKARYGVCAICGGLAQGDAMIIEAE